MGGENLKEPFHVQESAFGLLFEIDLVTTGSKGGSGRVFEALDGARFLFVEIDQLFVKNAKNAVESPVYFLDARVFARFLDDSGQACVNDGRGSAGLRDQEVTD